MKIGLSGASSAAQTSSSAQTNKNSSPRRASLIFQKDASFVERGTGRCPIRASTGTPSVLPGVLATSPDRSNDTTLRRWGLGLVPRLFSFAGGADEAGKIN